MFSSVSIAYGFVQALFKLLWERLHSNFLGQRNPPTITTLPLEIIVEVFKKMEYSDVLRVRRTCKLLHRATTARPIWENLFLECKDSLPGNLQLEKPLYMYSSEELERLVLVSKSTEVGWHTRDNVPSRQRSISMEDEPLYRRVYLVPGGRWLLVFRTEGEISYYDLDSADYEKKKILVPSYIRPARWNTVFFTVDASDRLFSQSFKLAQYVREDGSPEGSVYRAIKIWNIASVLEGHVVTGLEATCLKTILVDLEVEDVNVPLSMRDRTLAFSVSPPRNSLRGRRYICVIEWPSVKDGSLDYPRRVLYTIDNAREIHILPNNRVAAIAAPELLVYDYSSLDYVDHIPQHRLDHFELTPPMKCLLWLTPSNPMVSTPYEAQGGVHFFVVTKQTAQSIFIPDEFGAPGSSSNLTLDNFGTPGFSSPGLLRVQTLMHVPRHKYRDPFTARYSLGRSRAVLHYPNHETTSFEFFLLHYEQMFAPDYIPVVKVIPCKARSKRQQEQAVNPEPNPSLSAAWEYAMPYRNLLLDEGTGRVVVPFEKRFGLVDFALVHKYSSTS